MTDKQCLKVPLDECLPIDFRHHSLGRYQTTSEVVREALRVLERHGLQLDQAFQSLMAKLEQGAAEAEHGELLDGNEIVEELREMIEERRFSRAVNQ